MRRRQHRCFSTVIEIANPLPGGKRYTSITRAASFCAAGHARILEDGRLEFLPQAPRVRSREQRREDDERRAMAHYRGGDETERFEFLWRNVTIRDQATGEPLGVVGQQAKIIPILPRRRA